MGSLFDDHRTSSWPPTPRVPADTPPLAARRAARTRRLAPALCGLLVTFAALLGLAVGHAAWHSATSSPMADLGAPVIVPSTSPGAGGFPPAASGPDGGNGGGAYGGPVGAAPAGGAAAGSPGASAVAAIVGPGLVTIDSIFGYRGVQGAGTGIVLTASGEILTNNHVVDGASSIKVTDVGNGRTYPGTVVGYDPSRDIAVIRLQGASGLQTAALGDSATAAVGQSVLAIGNAGGAGTPISAPGSITAIGKSITAGDSSDGSSERLSGLIEVDANVQPGDSGGPLVDGSGRVIGVDTAASAGFSFRSPAGQGYAIPINDALSVVRQIEAGRGSATVHVGPTAFLGVLSSSVTGQPGRGSAGPGAQLAGVADGGAAQRAGLSAGDVITSLADQPVGSPAALRRLILGLKPGQSVPLGWTDSTGQAHTATVDLGSGPPA